MQGSWRAAEPHVMEPSWKPHATAAPSDAASVDGMPQPDTVRRRCCSPVTACQR